MTTSTLKAKPSAILKVRASGVHGRGVYATKFIRAEKRIIEYTGERTSWEDAPNDDTTHTFNFGLDNGEVINPGVGGNESRWINHSCDPNCEAVEEDDRIFIYALRDIAAGEELFYDYGLQIDEPITKKSKKEYECHCGAKSCRGTLLGLE
jgi:SET domain-containing protein